MMHTVDSPSAQPLREKRSSVTFAVTVILILMLLLPNVVSLHPLSALHQSTAYLVFFVLFNILTMFAAFCVVRSSRVFFLLLSPFAFIALPFAYSTMMFESVPGKLFVQVSLGTTAREVYGLTSVFGLIVLLPLIYGAVYIALAMTLKRSPVIDKPQRTALLAIFVIYIGSATAIKQHLGFTTVDLPVFEETMVTESYPVGLVVNALSALKKTEDSNPQYQSLEISAVDSDSDEVTVLVIGESVRSDHLSINGYHRPTTPRLLARKDQLVTYPDMLSFSNSTHQSVPGMLTIRDEQQDKTYSLIETYRQAGYQTAWISNQIPDIFSPNADYQEFSVSTWSDLFRQDSAMLTSIYSAIKQRRGKLLLIVHMLGSHIDYDYRYTAEDKVFVPRYSDLDSKGKTKTHQQALINSYDNSLRALDRFLDSIFVILEKESAPASLVFTSDHGENLFDDERELFMHASPHPTSYEVMVPLIIWGNNHFHSLRGNLFSNLQRQAATPVSHKNIFPTLLSLSAIDSGDQYKTSDLTSKLFEEQPRKIQNVNILLSEDELR